jgi:hypothetical protein
MRLQAGQRQGAVDRALDKRLTPEVMASALLTAASTPAAAVIAVMAAVDAETRPHEGATKMAQRMSDTIPGLSSEIADALGRNRRSGMEGSALASHQVVKRRGFTVSEAG